MEKMPIIKPKYVTDIEALCKWARIEDPDDRKRMAELAREAESIGGAVAAISSDDTRRDAARGAHTNADEDTRRGAARCARTNADEDASAGADGRAAAVYGSCVVDRISGDDVYIGKVKFNARPLSRLFAEGMTVYPYVATCGPNMAAHGKTFTDPLEQYWWDMIMQGAVGHARTALFEAVAQAVGYEPKTVSPGSIQLWPISNQPALFSLIGDVKSMIGVTIAESFLMLPLKSVSGIFFPGSGGFTHNCCICERKDCQGRRAPFDPDLKEQLEGGAKMI